MKQNATEINNYIQSKLISQNTIIMDVKYTGRL